jgi:hypothetical protein
MSLRALTLLNAAPAVVNNPTTIGTGLVAWFDTTNTGSITLSGSNVTQINDLSGNGHNATVSSGGASPTTSTAINSKQTFNFTDAAKSGLTFTQGSTLTNFSFGMVLKTSTNTNNDGLLTDYIATGNCNVIIGASNQVQCYMTSVGATNASAANSFNTGTAYFLFVTYATGSPGTLNMYLNNTNVLSQSTGAVLNARTLNSVLGWGYTSGWAQGFTGDSGDFMVYNNVLNSTDRGNLYTLFAKPKWGLP